HAAHPLIDVLRDKMVVEENSDYSADYHDPQKRSITNAVQVFFRDGSATDKVAVEYPIGHQRRREEGMPLLVDKFERHLATRFPAFRCEKISQLCGNQATLEAMPVDQFMSLWMI
ncbi:MAG: 2-methylcitrate dehydratase, partial [Halomonas sp.]